MRRSLASGVVAHALGNLLLGIALGIASYYIVTDALTAYRQAQLRSEMTGAIASPAPDRLLDPGGPVIDLEGWETEDLAYWQALGPGDIFGRLIIEGIEIDTVVLEGHERDVLKRGPGRIDYTDYPGATGNCGVSGHRTTYGAPFRHLDDLAEGDFIDLYSPYRRYRYEVARIFRVTPDRVDVVGHTEEARLTLTACDPPYSARYRLIVQSRLVEVRRLEQAGQGP